MDLKRILCYNKYIISKGLIFLNKDTAKKNTLKVLKPFAKLRSYTVLSDIDLEFKNKTAHIDHLLIAPFGVMFFSCLTLKKGEIFGSKEDSMWTVVTKTDRTKVKNPYLENENNNAIVREIFAKEQVYKIGFENTVIIDCPKKDVQIQAPVEALNILTPKELKKQLKRARYETDNGCDVKKITESIKKYEK